MEKHQIDQTTANKPQQVKNLIKNREFTGLHEQDPLLDILKSRSNAAMDAYLLDSLSKNLSNKISTQEIIKKINDTNSYPQPQKHVPESFHSRNKIQNFKPMKVRKLILNLTFELNQLKSHIEQRLRECNSSQIGYFNNDLLSTLKNLINEEVESKYSQISENFNRLFESQSKEIADLRNQLGRKINELNSNNRSTVSCDVSTKPQFSQIMNIQFGSLENEVVEIQQTIANIKQKIANLTQENLKILERASKLDSQICKQQADLNLKAKENIDINFQLSKVNKEIVSMKNENSREETFFDNFFKFQQATQDSFKNTLIEISLVHIQQNMNKCEELIINQKENMLDLYSKLEQTFKAKSREIESKLNKTVNECRAFFKKSVKADQETKANGFFNESLKNSEGMEKVLTMKVWKKAVQDTIIKYPDWHQNNLKRICEFYGGIDSPDNLLWKVYKSGKQSIMHLYETPDIFSEYEKITWEWKLRELDEDEAAKEVILKYILEWNIMDPKTMYYINNDCKKKHVEVLPGGKVFPYKITRITYTGYDLIWWIELLKGIIFKGKSLREVAQRADLNAKGICFVISHDSNKVNGKIGVIKDSNDNEGLGRIIKRAEETINIRIEERRIANEEKKSEKIISLNSEAKLRESSISPNNLADKDEDFSKKINNSSSIMQCKPLGKNSNTTCAGHKSSLNFGHTNINNKTEIKGESKVSNYNKSEWRRLSSQDLNDSGPLKNVNKNVKDCEHIDINVCETEEKGSTKYE